MPRQTVAYTNFTAGQLSPRLDGRTDLSKYYNGAKQLTNFTIQPHGGATRRPGTRFIHEVKSSSAAVRLIPFEFSTVQTYVMEFGNQYIRFYKDKGIITESAKAISAATKANPGVITANSLKAEYQEKLRLARHADATEGTADVIDSSTFINARF